MALPPINARAAQRPAATTPAASDARSAAQRAFFNAALDKAAPTTRAVSVQRLAAPVRAEARAVQPSVTRLLDEKTVPPLPGRMLRPGSLIDIKV